MLGTDKARLHAIIEGHVQGVSFRYFVQELANMHNLTGWVRNRWDGSVEVTAEGDRGTLKLLLAALYRGPQTAVVTGLNPEWSEATGEFSHFNVKGTV